MLLVMVVQGLVKKGTDKESGRIHLLLVKVRELVVVIPNSLNVLDYPPSPIVGVLAVNVSRFVFLWAITCCIQ